MCDYACKGYFRCIGISSDASERIGMIGHAQRFCMYESGRRQLRREQFQFARVFMVSNGLASKRGALPLLPRSFLK